MQVSVIGAGLAGCEATWQLARRGIAVTLYEMKPAKRTPAHHSDDFAELCCSNSLRSDQLENAVGLLKEELRRCGSLILACADEHRVEAGGALAVDREGFSREVTERIRTHPLITVEEGEVSSIPEKGDAIVASGPLTSDALAGEIQRLVHADYLSFFDAAAPLVTFESLDMEHAWFASRYDKGTADYVNCALSEEEYAAFWQALTTAQEAEVHGFEDKSVFEGCMPVEIMAKRGDMTLAFGPLRPVGLSDPRLGERPFAVVQLRQDDAEGTLYNIVGFQTNLKFGEQRCVFGMIPGLQNAEFVRYGVMHRNTFLNSPGKLDPWYQVKAREGLYFAGQITGVEGYVESAASGMVAGIDLAHKLLGKPRVEFTARTALGALGHYVSGYAGKDFQPMNISFGIIEGLTNPPRNKQERYTRIAERSLEWIGKIAKDCE